MWHRAQRGSISPPVLTFLIILAVIGIGAVLFTFGVIPAPMSGKPKVEPVKGEPNEPTETNPRTGTLAVTTTPEGAYVFVKSGGGGVKYLGKTPLKSEIQVNPYTVYVFYRGVLVKRKLQITDAHPQNVTLNQLDTRDSDDLRGKDMVYMPEGWFEYGSAKGQSNERPVKRVWIDAYYIDKHEVSNERYALFAAYMQSTNDHSFCYPEETSRGHKQSFRTVKSHDGTEVFDKDDQPAASLDWFDAYSYARWAGKRLPTEAEWEKAASWDPKARKKYDFPWMYLIKDSAEPEIEKRADIRKFDKGTCSVRAHGPDSPSTNGASPIGCLNMIGNVSEWVMDWYAERYYREIAVRNPTGPKYNDGPDVPAMKRVYLKSVRGASGNYHYRVKNKEYRFTTYARYFYNPDFRHMTIGFRCVRPAPKKKDAEK